MGILKTHNNKLTNILTEHGFTLEKSNVTGSLNNCYERSISSRLYTAWIAIEVETGEVCVYIEYECGGEVTRYTTTLASKWMSSEDDFFNELDDYVSDVVKPYINERI